MRNHLRTSAICALAALPILPVASVNADVMARGQGLDRGAEVIFGVSGNLLRITLSNSSQSDVLVPGDVLTAVFFDIDGSMPSLSPLSAVLGNGSAVRWGNAGAGGEVGGEWAFRGGLTGAPSGASYGISTAGFGLFGPHDSFPGANLDGQNGPQGLNYGLLSAGDNLLTGNTPVTGQVPLTQSSVVFTLQGLPEGFDAASIRNVSVQYGTSLGEPSLIVPIVSAPAPGPAALLGVALGLASVRRRRS